MPRRLVPALLFLLASFARGATLIDPQSALDDTLERAALPRPLMAADVGLSGSDIAPLAMPEGDFDGDGAPDIAISGIYDLASGPDRFFILVVTRFSDPVRYRRLYLSKYDAPAFLHGAGTTGGTGEAFSVSFCSACPNGFDVAWNPKKKHFEERPWTKERFASPVTAAPAAVPDDLADRALRTVGALPDVIVFVEGVKKAKGMLGTRVEAGKREGTVTVVVFEKVGKKENEYDRIVVGNDGTSVVSRRRAGRSSRKASHTSR